MFYSVPVYVRMLCQT